MKKNYKKFVLFFLLAILSSFILLVNTSYATPVTEDLKGQLSNAGNPWGGGTPTSSASLGGIVATVIKALLSLLGIIFLVLIIYAGFMWMTAQGDEEKVTKAKDTITRAVIGLVIIILAYAITYFVFSSLPGGSNTGVGGGGSESL